MAERLPRRFRWTDWLGNVHAAVWFPGDWEVYPGNRYPTSADVEARFPHHSFAWIDPPSGVSASDVAEFRTSDLRRRVPNPPGDCPEFGEDEGAVPPVDEAATLTVIDDDPPPPPAPVPDPGPISWEEVRREILELVRELRGALR